MAEDDPALDYGDYTVGIMCALGLETNAVRHNLDREHQSLPVNSRDSTIYVLGELSGHQVVIACLPDTQGKSASATAATHMARTFPSIKHRFLVGTGAGVPSMTNDIRLGDVVVSMPTTTHGGVVQYDLGKDNETAFVRKGVTSPAPSVLRAAVYKMQIEHDYQFNRKKDLSGPTPDAYPRPSEPDILFEATYPHQSTESSCEGCDPKMAVTRSIRPEDTPRIFYGLIASGDRVVKSGTKRDAIVGTINDDVLCLEMEAAGFMHEFPAVVIRGISNYADSHKNDGWQHYAAASAAACAKELLSHLEPEKPPRDPVPPATRELLHRFLADVCETDPQNEMERIRQSKGGLITECSRWIMESPELETWQTRNEARLLWLKGGPQKGKTMAMINMVDQQTRQIADRGSFYYFFCDHNLSHLNNAVSVLRAIIWKLLWTNQWLYKYIPDEYRCNKDYGRDIFDGQHAFAMLTTMLSRILGDRALGKVLIVIDAIDECNTGMVDLLEWILQQSSDSLANVKWLISSRHAPQIEELLRPGGHKICLDLDANEAHALASVDYFIEHEIGRIAQRKGLSPRERNELEVRLKDKSGSTFLWVAFVCQRLQATSRRGIKRELEKFPANLGPLYDRMLEKLETLDDEDKELCKGALRVVVIAPRPLSLEELGAVIGLPVDAIDDVFELVELGCSFLSIRDGHVYLIHKSVKDYFSQGMGQRLFADGLPNEHNAVLRRLLDVMQSPSDSNIHDLSHPDNLIEDAGYLRSDPVALVGYASTKWMSH